jgi:hypothetical protein
VFWSDILDPISFSRPSSNRCGSTAAEGESHTLPRSPRDWGGRLAATSGAGMMNRGIFGRFSHLKKKKDPLGDSRGDWAHTGPAALEDRPGGADGH